MFSPQPFLKAPSILCDRSECIVEVVSVEHCIFMRYYYDFMIPKKKWEISSYLTASILIKYKVSQTKYQMACRD